MKLALAEARRFGVSLPLNGLWGQLGPATSGVSRARCKLAAMLSLLERAAGLEPGRCAEAGQTARGRRTVKVLP